MPSTHTLGDTGRGDPLEMVEQIVRELEWSFQRHGTDELTVDLESRYGDYRLWFSWRDELSVLSLSCAFDATASGPIRRSIDTLLALLNRKLPIGHFNYLAEEGIVHFHHALLLSGGQVATREQIEDLVAIAVGECERAYPAFQFVIWGGKNPEEAVAAALLETVGEA